MGKAIEELREHGYHQDETAEGCYARAILEVAEQLERHEEAISTVASWLAQTPGVWGQKDFDGIMRILRGEEGSGG